MVNLPSGITAFIGASSTAYPRTISLSNSVKFSRYAKGFDQSALSVD